jgi:hypothetical protein
MHGSPGELGSSQDGATQIAGRSIEITGAVLDAEGRPIEEARVYLVEGPVPLADIAAVTDNSGRFVLSVPAPGTYRLGVTAEGSVGIVQEMSTIDTGEEKRIDLEVRLDMD